MSTNGKIIVRDQLGGYQLRSGNGAANGAAPTMPTMFGHFARFGEWAEINSSAEGHFLERIDPGAFRRQFAKGTGAVKVLLNHGGDPHVGNKPLGTITELRADAKGAYYEVALLDTSYNRDLLPGLQARLYGSSFRFRVLVEDVDSRPRRSHYNPDGLPERVVKDVELFEFGPVTFPAYAGATAGVRTHTNGKPRFRNHDEFLAWLRHQGQPRRFRNKDEFLAWLVTHV